MRVGDCPCIHRARNSCSLAPAHVTQENVFQSRLLAFQPVQLPARGHRARDACLDAVARIHLAFDALQVASLPGHRLHDDGVDTVDSTAALAQRLGGAGDFQT